MPAAHTLALREGCDARLGGTVPHCITDSLLLCLTIHPGVKNTDFGHPTRPLNILSTCPESTKILVRFKTLNSPCGYSRLGLALPRLYKTCCLTSAATT